MTEQELLGYLRDAAQGASNSAASTVSAPVDLLAWLLRKGGVPVGDAPVMGSDWMAQRGFTAQPKNALAGLAGETVGNILPIAAAAKAPQIANALIRGQDAAGRGAVALGQKGADMAGDYMARQGMIQPATVWHGSPHKFDAFDASKIGTGEGAQAYGHGLYLADAPDVAQSYQALGHMQGNVGTVGKTPIHEFYSQIENQANRLPPQAAAPYYDRLAMLEDLMSNTYPTKVLENAKSNGYSPESIAWLQKQVLPNYNPAGNLYKVDLPDSAIAKMLDWDKPLSQQAPEVQAALRKQGISGKEWDIAAVGDGPRGYLNDRFVFDSAIQAREELNALRAQGYTARPLKPESATLTVQDLVKGQNQDIYAERLRKAGIPGIRYLDGGSRGAGAGTSNYVVFPGNENLLRILERNGVPIGQ